MKPETHDDWIDEVAARRLTREERERWRESMAARPAERRRLERELALNDLLDGHRPAPPVSGNFVSRVLAEATRPAPTRSVGGVVADWLRRLALPRVAAFAALALAVGAGWWGIDSRRQERMARGAVEVVRASAGIDAQSLVDFDAVRRLDTAAKPDDDALIVALAQ
ncbi:MAG: hypothetical protein DVB31_08825 [Verrucomicrobia bacterium]|nr:MAG: hypothetical protein DVB31_08825 [Verrucomicrobiota bacterium]